MKLQQILTKLTKVDGRRKFEKLNYESKLFSMRKEGYEMVIHSFFAPSDIDKVIGMVQSKLRKLNVTEFEPAGLSKREASRENLLRTCEVSYGQIHLSIYFTVPF